MLAYIHIHNKKLVLYTECKIHTYKQIKVLRNFYENLTQKIVKHVKTPTK